jgi:hypothetical protein
MPDTHVGEPDTHVVLSPPHPYMIKSLYKIGGKESGKGKRGCT